MSNTLQLYRMTLANNEIYDDWDNYLNMIGNDSMQCFFDFKEPTSILSPTIVVTANFGTIQKYNYARLLIDDDQGSFISRCYIIRDIVTINLHQCEVRLDFDAFRSINWRNSGTSFKLALTTDERKWAQTIVDPRFEPYASYAGNGSYAWKFETGIPSIELADQDDETGLYLVKWWYGYEDGVDSLGTVCGMMNTASFNFFISKVNHFIEDHYGAQLGGITDFTKFIVSAKYFPSLKISECRKLAGYSAAWTGVGVGGLCTVDASDGYENFKVYIKRDKAGFIDSYFYNDDEDLYFEARPLGYYHSTHENNLKKMKFLTSSKWCQYMVRTPIGVGAIDMSTVRHGDKLFYNSQIDLESGIMTFNIMRNKTDSTWTTEAKDADILLSLQGPVYYDMIDKFTHIQSANEVIINSFVNSELSAAKNFVGSMAVDDATPSKDRRVENSAEVGIAGEVMQIPFKQLEALCSPRIINQPRSSGGDNLYWLHRNSDSLKYFYVRTTIFMNPDTPLYDDLNTTSARNWNAEVLYEKYRDWCRQPGNGYPSIAVCNFDNSFLDSGTTWFKCADVYEIRPNASDKLLITPQIEAMIKTKLLSGVLIHPGPIRT